MLMDFCHKAKNLYNHANYVVRQEFTSGNRWVRYAELDKILKTDSEYPDYAAMPSAQSSQQILRLLDKNWKSFFTSIKDWKKHPGKYPGRPKLPKYLKKEGKYLLILTNQNCRLKNGLIYFPKSFEGFTVKPAFTEKPGFLAFNQARIIPHRNKLVVEIIYTINRQTQKQDNGRHIGIDIGINNLMTVCNSFGGAAFIVNGKPVKAANQFYNKEISHYREICKRMNGRDYTGRMDMLTGKRNAKIDDYLHKASRYVVDYCVKNEVSVIVIGKNDEWKQNSKLSKRMNQHFVQIPFARLIEMIRYKAEECGIAVVMTEESYTSGTSFIDNEEPAKENYNRNRRMYRGLFRSNDGILINADLNGAYQILKKVFTIKCDRGCALHPAVVNLG
ncbi:MAG: IS200/IS605 family element transposase accessory protein TnpB [Lachnospiraceae bacterium]|nr:IS200/IS605 family element transposase accessory protein TnpB [Lachnospiraceae bacterium]